MQPPQLEGPCKAPGLGGPPDSELGEEDILLLHIALRMRRSLLRHAIDADVAVEGQVRGGRHLARQCTQHGGLAAPRGAHQRQQPVDHQPACVRSVQHCT